jgi:hypothetical protein
MKRIRPSTNIRPSPRRVLETWSALVGIWGSSYLALLDELSLELAAWSETMQWPCLIIGAVGTGSALVSSWQVSRERSWRIAHGLRG